MRNEDCLKITILGDIMSDATQIEKSLAVGYDYIFENIANDFINSDLLIANLETPISTNPDLYAKQEFSFCAPKELPASLSKLNKNLVLLTANNHCLDRGIEGLDETISVLDELGIKHTGTQSTNENTHLSLLIGNYRVGVLNYTYGTNAFNNKVYLGSDEQKKVNLLQNQELSNKLYRYFISSKFFPVRLLRKLCKIIGILQIDTMPYERISFSKKKENTYLHNLNNEKKTNDIVISCLHIGGQYNTCPSKYTNRVINKTIKSNCDVISANHEHVIHPIKLQNGRFINYSLGNFLGSNGVIKEPYDKMSDYSIVVNIYIDNSNILNRQYSYSIYKCENEDGLVRVYSLYDLLSKNPNRKDLIHGLERITQYLSGKSMPLKKEYFV